MAKGYTVLVVDAGGRGSALVHKYSLSPKVARVLCVPGNDLTGLNSKKPVKIYPHLETTSVDEIVKICKKEKVDLVDVNQDNAVEAGLTDTLIKNGIRAIGPSRLAGQIEWDKAWARDFMRKYKIPQPAYRVFSSQREGISYIKKQKEGKWFIKASGLALGKGALPAENKKHAIERIQEMKKFGKSGDTYVVEEWLEGEEFSLFALCDGNSYQIVGCAQDHKRMYNWDLGENTGGIGCSSPPLVVTPKVLRETDKNIIKKTVYGLKKEKRDFKGILYLGAILVRGKVYVIEFNARWGSPEAEVLVPAIMSDIFAVSDAMIDGKLSKIKVKIDKKARVAVTLSLRENPTPTNSKDGKRRFYGVDEAKHIPGVTLYGARISKKGKKYRAASGRLLHIVGEGKNVIEARERAYQAAGLFSVEGNNLHYRTDIGWRDVERLRAS